MKGPRLTIIKSKSFKKIEGRHDGQYFWIDLEHSGPNSPPTALI